MILQGKCALISGGSRGIGRAISELYYKEGAELFIMSRHADQLEKAAAEIDCNHENRVHAIPCDVSSKESVDAAFAKIKEMGKDIGVCTYSCHQSRISVFVLLLLEKQTEVEK